jgi:hypothetical protein
MPGGIGYSPVMRSIFALLAMLLIVAPVAAGEPTAALAQKTVRLLMIGNSFSHNATAYLAGMAKDADRTVVLGFATISGAPFERHIRAAERYEADMNNPAGKPYTLTMPGGAKMKVSLRDMLASEPWDYVAIHQASRFHDDVKTYLPDAKNLAEYIRTHAPSAKLLMMETWAPRPDHPVYKATQMTPEQMYEKIHNAYAEVAKELGAEVVPVGSAIHAAMHDERWEEQMPLSIDPDNYVHPNLPPQTHSLYLNAYWDTNRTPPLFVVDAAHLSPNGRYLASCVFYEFLFRDILNNTHGPAHVAHSDARLFREIASRTVRGDAGGE